MLSMNKSEVPVRISITGMDGSGKSSAYRAFAEGVPQDLTVVRVSRFCSVIQGGKEQLVNRDVSQKLDDFHSWADKTKNRAFITLANTLWVLYSWRIMAPKLEEEFHPDLVLALRDPYIDPMAYAKYYSTRLLGSRNLRDREKLLKRIHGAPVSNSIIFMDVEPQTAVERIDQRIADERLLPDAPERTKWIHLHENVPDLVGIRQEYGSVLDYFQSNHGVDVLRVDTMVHDKEESGRIVRDKLLKPFRIASNNL